MDKKRASEKETIEEEPLSLSSSRECLTQTATAHQLETLDS